jgi:hypothetical protein
MYVGRRAFSGPAFLTIQLVSVCRVRPAKTIRFTSNNRSLSQFYLLLVASQGTYRLGFDRCPLFHFFAMCAQI